MNGIVKTDGIAAPELLARGRDFLGVMRRAFDAEGCDRHRKSESLAEIDAILPSLPVLQREVAASLRPASEKEIAARLAMLLKAFPNVGKDDGAAFGRLLLEDVISQKPSLGALDAGCAHVRRTSRFLPSIAEVLEAVNAAQNSLTTVLDKIDQVADSKSRLEVALKERPRLIRSGQ